jgi:hypothetical protein
MRMAMRKVRDGVVGYEIPFKLKEVNLGTDRDDEPVMSCVIEWIERDATQQAHTIRQRRSDIDFENALTKALRSMAKTSSQWTNGTGGAAPASADSVRDGYRGSPDGAPWPYAGAAQCGR